MKNRTLAELKKEIARQLNGTRGIARLNITNEELKRIEAHLDELFKQGYGIRIAAPPEMLTSVDAKQWPFAVDRLAIFPPGHKPAEMDQLTSNEITASLKNVMAARWSDAAEIKARHQNAIKGKATARDARKEKCRAIFDRRRIKEPASLFTKDSIVRYIAKRTGFSIRSIKEYCKGLK